MIGSPVVMPQTLDLVTAVTLRFEEHFMEMASLPSYTAFKKFVKMDDPAQDLIYQVYSEPLAAMPEWKGPRHMSEVQFRSWTKSIRTFATSMQINVDDVKADSGNVARQMAYMQAAERLAESAALLWPGLVTDAITAGVTGVWQPDGQKIFDLHPINPSLPNGTTFRNYFANSGQGGSAAMPITYGNVLARLKAGYGFKAPNGLDMPIMYNVIATSPSNVPLLSRLVKDERIPAAEASGTTTYGGDVQNEIRNHYGGGAIEVVGVANMPSKYWMLVDTSIPSEIPMRLKERQPITWQYQGPGGPEGAFPIGNDEGQVSSSVFESNTAKYGPKARGEAYFSNWWRAALCDSTP